MAAKILFTKKNRNAQQHGHYDTKMAKMGRKKETDGHEFLAQGRTKPGSNGC
jgi:hypothetical protein